MENRNKRKKSLIKGAVHLTMAGLLTRVLGLANRMVLSRLIGAEGLGLFQMVMPIYALLAVTAGLGLSGAVTKMVADRYARGDHEAQVRVRGFALRLAMAAALACAVLLWTVLCFPLEFVPDQRVILAVKLMPAAFFFAALSSILRSFTQGQSNMTPTALSQVGEQVARVALGLSAAYYLLPLGLEYALAGIVAGIAAGELVCFGILVLMQPERKIWKSTGRVQGTVLKEIYLLSVPILIIRLSTSVTHTVESMLIPSRLQVAGFSASEATIMFGQLSGMALPLVFLPTVLIIPLNTTLVPAVAGAVTLRLRQRLFRLVRLALWGSLALGAASSIILYTFAPVLTAALYNDASAARLVALLAPLVPFAYMQFTTAAILHGMGYPGIAVANDLGGTLISLAIIYFLTAQPGWGINGVICGYTAAFTLVTFLDCAFIYHLMRKI